MNVLRADRQFILTYERWFESRWAHIRNSGVSKDTGQITLRFGLSPQNDASDAVRELASFLPFVAEIKDENLPNLEPFKCLRINHVAPKRGLDFFLL